MSTIILLLLVVIPPEVIEPAVDYRGGEMSDTGAKHEVGTLGSQVIRELEGRFCEHNDSRAIDCEVCVGIAVENHARQAADNELTKMCGFMDKEWGKKFRTYSKDNDTLAKLQKIGADLLKDDPVVQHMVKQAADTARREENEACAKVRTDPKIAPTVPYMRGYDNGQDEMAQAIRARLAEEGE